MADDFVAAWYTDRRARPESIRPPPHTFIERKSTDIETQRQSNTTIAMHGIALRCRIEGHPDKFLSMKCIQNR